MGKLLAAHRARMGKGRHLQTLAKGQELKVDIDKLICQKEEVEDLKLVTTKTYYDLLNDAKTSNHFIASNKKYYEFVLKSIQNKINTKHHSL